MVAAPSGVPQGMRHCDVQHGPTGMRRDDNHQPKHTDTARGRTMGSSCNRALGQLMHHYNPPSKYSLNTRMGNWSEEWDLEETK